MDYDSFNRDDSCRSDRATYLADSSSARDTIVVLCIRVEYSPFTSSERFEVASLRSAITHIRR